jgi:dethiobiotin synthetase
MKTLLITGTDTDTGKTVVTLALRSYYKKYFPHFKVGLMKLLQTGKEGDCQFYQQFFPDALVPLSFAAPVAPPLAAQKENKYIDLSIVWQALSNLQREKDFVLVEALGGLGSPVTDELTVADLAGSWHLDTILVVPVKLGTIGQSVANAALARQSKINLKGIILNCVTPCAQEEINDWTPINLIESLTHLPVLGIFPYLENISNLELLAQAASNLNLNITQILHLPRN